MGVSVSYSGAWKYLKQLTNESMYTEAVRSGHWLWVYDNLNIHKSVRHEREGIINLGKLIVYGMGNQNITVHMLYMSYM